MPLLIRVFVTANNEQSKIISIVSDILKIIKEIHMDTYIKDKCGEGYELIMNADEIETFEAKYLVDKGTQAYQLDDGSIAYAGERIIAGINDKFFKDEESYGKYLVDYFGDNVFQLPYLKEKRI